jgi:YegS/Rv2252/BmrU family lipid kinase
MNDCIKKICVIINPASGTSSKKKLPSLIKNYLNLERFDLDIVFTKYKGHASEFTRKAINEGADYVIAVGGDGTVNEIAKEMVHSPAALGIIPVGSGNGLARDLGISMDIRKSLDAIIKGNVIAIDYCKANEHFFFCTCGVGFDAMVSERFSNEGKRGPITYMKSAITEYIKFKPNDYEVILDDNSVIREKAFLVTCANISQYGNNAFIAPNADMQDGKVDIAIIAPVNPLDIGPIAIQLFTRSITHNHKMNLYRSNKVIINRTDPGPMHIDGTPVYAGKEIIVQTIPSGLKVIVPARR